MPGKPREPETITLSPISPDPVASMRIWGVDVELGDSVFRVPGLDASHWLEILLADEISYEDLFPGLAGGEAILNVNQMLLDGKVTNDDLEQAILDLLEEVSGRRWWITIRLCVTLRKHWESVGGELARHGVTPFGVSLSYWLDAAYTTMCHLILGGPKPKNAEQWTRALTDPPVQVKREFDEEANADAFLAALRAAR